jgi:hypothetical protein
MPTIKGNHIINPQTLKPKIKPTAATSRAKPTATIKKIEGRGIISSKIKIER